MVPPSVSHICIVSFSSPTGMAMVTSWIHSFQFCYRSRIQSTEIQSYLSFKSPDIIYILDLGRLFTLIWWWACCMANQGSHPTWTSVWKSRRVWRSRCLFRHVRSFVFYICIQLNPMYLGMPTPVTNTLSQELLVFWVTVRRNTTMETMAMVKPSEDAPWVLLSRNNYLQWLKCSSKGQLQTHQRSHEAETNIR